MRTGAGLTRAACGEPQPATTALSPSPNLSQGGCLSFLVSHFLLLTASDQASGGAGIPVCPTGAWAALSPVPVGVPASSLRGTSLPSLAAKSRAILLPMDLDAHMSALLSSGGSCSAAAQRSAANYKTATRTFPRVIPTANQWDYKNIIEKLQVGVAAQPPRRGPLRPRWQWGWVELLSVEWVGYGHALVILGQVVTLPSPPGHHHGPGGAAEASGAG